MFNINDVSRMLREARIQKNLTQNALADQMGVTYQAVSNWERGTSVPDISNLARLCEILELDLYKLVGASQSQELTEELLASPDRLDSAPVDAIAAIAPMLPPRELEELVRAKKADIRNLSTLMQIAPFIDAELAEEIGAELTPAHIADVLGMSPFVSPELCAKWVERLERQGDLSWTRACYPRWDLSCRRKGWTGFLNGWSRRTWSSSTASRPSFRRTPCAAWPTVWSRSRWRIISWACSA